MNAGHLSAAEWGGITFIGFLKYGWVSQKLVFVHAERAENLDVGVISAGVFKQFEHLVWHRGLKHIGLKKWRQVRVLL